jgi:YidC/Oxa1 family membrane protein insertase
MDTRKLITAVLLTFAVVLLFNTTLTWLAKKNGWTTARPPEPPAAATQPATAPANVPTTSETSPGSATGPAASMSAAGMRIVPATQPAAPIQIGSAAANDPNYRLAVTLAPEGAGIEQVVLNAFKRTVKGDDRYTFEQPYPGAESPTRPLATRALNVDGTNIDLHNVAWQFEPSMSSQAMAAYSTTIENDSGPLLRVTKSFEVLPGSDASKGYEVPVQLAFQNLTDRAVTVRATNNGPTTPPREIDRGPDRYVIAGYYDKETPGDPITVANHAVEEFSKDSATQDITRSKKYSLPLAWAGASITFFDAVVLPLPGSDKERVPQYIQKVQAAALNPDAPVEDRHVTMTFETSDFKLEPGQTQSIAMRVFFGPKQRSLLQEPYYSQPAIAYSKTLVITGGLCAFCTFQWLIDILVMMLRAFHWLFGGFMGHGDWGLAIIGLVAVVRGLLHPITKKSQVAMMRMQKMAPEMEKLRQKYKDDKEGLSKAMWELQKEQGIGAYLGCLPMFLQMPIWIALWSALNSTFELRQASFLWGFTWIHDLSKPDHLIELANPFNLFFLHISGLNILPLLLAVVFYFQMKTQPKPATMTPEQEQQQKIMQWMMPVLFPLMLYNGPSGLNLYILTSTLTGIIESKKIRDHIKQREEAEKEGRVIVDAGKKFGSRDKGPPTDKKRTAQGGFGGWLANLQERAEQLREAQRKGKS